MKLKTEKHYSCEWFWNYKPIRKCHNVVKTVTHYKKKPECKTVPKYHCEEKWDKDEYEKKAKQREDEEKEKRREYAKDMNEVCAK